MITGKKRLVQCHSCGHVWTPRKSKVGYCPRCKVWVGERARDLGSGERALPKDQPPIWNKEGTLEINDQAKACSVCGKYYKKTLLIERRRFCRHCLFNLMAEDQTGEMDIY